MFSIHGGFLRHDLIVGNAGDWGAVPLDKVYALLLDTISSHAKDQINERRLPCRRFVTETDAVVLRDRRGRIREWSILNRLTSAESPDLLGCRFFIGVGRGNFEE